MNERNLTVVEELENELRDRLNQQKDTDYLLSDLAGLYVEIISEISRIDRAKSTIIYDYTKLLELDLQNYSGAEAYIAGCEAKDKPEFEVINDYMRKIAKRRNKRRFDKRIYECFNEISRLIGNKKSLITEFTEIYYAVHGVIASNIHEFIHLGQMSDEDMVVVVV